MAGQKAILSWSGGKDSAMALYQAMLSGKWDIRYLLTTIHKDHRWVNIHGTHETLIDAQAAAIGIPLLKVYLDSNSNACYEESLSAALQQVAGEGIHDVLFGDIFLEDLRAYREGLLEKNNMKGAFPLWKQPSRDLVQYFLSNGFQSICCAVDADRLNASFAGRLLNPEWFAALPASIDPCGENGEYHSFCFDGPVFSRPLRVQAGAALLHENRLSGQDSSRSWLAPISLV